MPKKVVIVGAGISGLAAARHLHQSKLYDVTILEAENCIGGRIRSTDFHGELVELGAQWVHGTKGNEIYKFAKENEIKLITSVEEDEVYAPSTSGRVVNADGKAITREELDLFCDVDDLLDGLEDKAAELAEVNEDQLKFINSRSLAEELWKAKMEQTGIKENIPKSITKAMFEHIMTVANLIDGCCPEETSLFQYYLYEELQGPHMTFQEGYSTVAKVLSQNLPKSCIKLGCRVGEINWKEPGNILVQYTDQEGKNCSLQADHVIVTVSLGCLKEFHKDMFKPQLPIEKKNSIENFGFGSISKVFLYYKEPFWKNNEFPLYILWDKDIEMGPGREWCKLLECIEDCSANILMCWVTAKIEKAIEGKSTKEIGQDVTYLLRKYSNNSMVPEPDDVLYRNWAKNDNFLGSYSYCSLGSSKEDISNLSTPLEVDGVPRVLFCGEATHGTRFSTADGALDSGVREAKRLIDWNQAESEGV